MLPAASTAKKAKTFDARKNEPLANLFVTMLQRMGVEADSFASGKSTMRGIKPKGA